VRVSLTDGRIIIMLVSAFPGIKKLSLRQRKNWYLFGNGFSFVDCNEVYRTKQVLGISENYRHDGNNNGDFN
jgi:hypothetical protein